MMQRHYLVLPGFFDPRISIGSKDSSSISHSLIETKLIYLSAIEIADWTSCLSALPFPSFFASLFSVDRSQYFSLAFDAREF
jgi:hypothetical protein